MVLQMDIKYLPLRVHTPSSQSIWPSGTPRHSNSFHRLVPLSAVSYLRAFFLFLPPLGLPSDLVLAGLGLADVVTGVLAAGALAAGGGGTALAGLTTGRLGFFSFFWPRECIARMSKLPIEPDAGKRRKSDMALSGLIRLCQERHHCHVYHDNTSIVSQYKLFYSSGYS
jgi:hypothetical protein